MRALVSVAAVCAALAGCGPASPVPQDVKGTITLDGKPMPDGKVHFAPSGGPPIVADVRNGAFELKAVPGPYKVEVWMFRDRIPWPGEPHDKQINVLPERFNSGTTLTAEVKTGEENRPAFAVQSR